MIPTSFNEPIVNKNASKLVKDKHKCILATSDDHLMYKVSIA